MGTDVDGTFYWDIDTLGFIAVAAVFTAPYAVAAQVALHGRPLRVVAGVAIALVWLLFWLPASAPFKRGARIYLLKPNRYADVYEDAASRHWLQRRPARA